MIGMVWPTDPQYNMKLSLIWAIHFLITSTHDMCEYSFEIANYSYNLLSIWAHTCKYLFSFAAVNDMPESSSSGNRKKEMY
jgi:hypothetical protein